MTAIDDQRDEQLERRVRAALDALAADYEMIDCDPALADTATFCERYGYSLDESANCIIVVGKGATRSYVACLALADSRLDVNGLIRKRLGVKRTSFAGADETVVATDGMRIGGVTPFGLPTDFPVWVDQRVVDRARVIVGGGSRRCKVLVASAAFARMPGAEIITDLARSVEPLRPDSSSSSA